MVRGIERNEPSILAFLEIFEKKRKKSNFDCRSNKQGVMYFFELFMIIICV
jgi:hypothetical protein